MFDQFYIIFHHLKACWQHVFLLIFLSIHSYWPSLLTSLLDGIQYSHRTKVSRFFCSANIGVSMCRSPLENITYEFVLGAQHILLILFGWFVGWKVAVQMLFCGVMHQDLCKIAHKIFAEFSSIFTLDIPSQSKWYNHTIALICL